MSSRIGGVVYLKVDDKGYTLGEGEVTYNLGRLKREGVLSSSGVAGHSAKPQVPFCEGEIIFTNDLDIDRLLELDDVERVTMELYNGRTFILKNAWWAGEGDIKSDGKMNFRFEGLSAEMD